MIDMSPALLELEEHARAGLRGEQSGRLVAATAIREIRERRLWPQEVRWPEYVYRTFGITVERADQLIEFVEIRQSLAGDRLPDSERQTRALKDADSGDRQSVWERACRASGKKLPTSTTIAAIVRKDREADHERRSLAADKQDDCGREEQNPDCEEEYCLDITLTADITDPASHFSAWNAAVGDADLDVRFNCPASRVTEMLDSIAFLLDGEATRVADQGFQCQAFCGAQLTGPEEQLAQEMLARQDMRYEVRKTRFGNHECRMIFALDGKIPLTIFENASTRGGWAGDDETRAFLTACEMFLKNDRPDVVWTFGADWGARKVQFLAKALDIPVLFALHDLADEDADAFRCVDYAVVPSESARQHYWERIGLVCHVLAYPADRTGDVSRLPERLAPLYSEFFANLFQQPSPPLVPIDATPDIRRPARMTQPTAYQYVKLGSNLEFLRGISAISLMQTTDLAAFPSLAENLSRQRYSVLRVVGAVKSLLVLLHEIGLDRSLAVADGFRPMLREMESYLTRDAQPQLAYLKDPFAERLVALAKQVGAAVRSELGMAGQEAPAKGPEEQNFT